MKYTRKLSLPIRVFLWICITAFPFTPTCFAVQSKGKLAKSAQFEESPKKQFEVAPETVTRFERKANRGFVFTVIGVGFLLATILALSLGTLGTVVPLGLLGLAAIFGNIGFVKALRVRMNTKFQRKQHRKARKKAKATLILACALGITLLIGLLFLLDRGPAL